MFRAGDVVMVNGKFKCEIVSVKTVNGKKLYECELDNFFSKVTIEFEEKELKDAES